MTEISGKTKMLAVLGSPISHSNSPRIHNGAFEALGLDCVYLAYDVNQEQLKEAIVGMKALGAAGFSVTMPNKQVVGEYLDGLSREAALCGAVNCVCNENGKLIGYNTDGVGFIDTLRENEVKIEGAKMTLIGTGGASSSICTQAALDGMKEVTIFGIKDPTFESGLKLAERINSETECHVEVFELSEEELLRKHIEESSILANATPVGMGKMVGMSPIKDESMLRKDLVVMDVIYNPEKSRLLEMAEEQGCKIINGKNMLMYQGAKSFEIWTGQKMPLEVVRPIIG
ncbi:shikimate dehydrogenase [Aequitasia blattaphilus]|uniref:Shikimate dehydrogenase (NADP(+)) n=1 Tax=Aequitasia blattaphilus TaxID=2949332 RepID=A0ABT1ECI5_9FIRM|nr:shikimate dehydrogenase [Aequitasia blattaphilus]MCP1103540.1 shikimate dehydrogenase [Aequitasia blattaphilus]MCR8616180.1 shikimate dehydrogenase [Aequitasia blattaphilus]